MSAEYREYIVEWLTRNGWSRKRLARGAGIAESYMTAILTGRRRPGLTTLRRLEEAMGLPAGTLTALAPVVPARPRVPIS